MSERAGGFRYGAWRGGPDPLAPPYDVREALDELGDSVLDGGSPTQALSELLRRGPSGRRGLDDLLRSVRKRQRQVRRRGQLDGTLREVRALLDQAIGQERAELFPDPSDDARLREAELDGVPNDPARAVRSLAGYEWRSERAAATYQRIRELLRSEVLDAQFRGLKQALENAAGPGESGSGPGGNDQSASLDRVKDMLAELNRMLAADARGQDTSAAFEAFMAAFGDFFPDDPATLDELVDSLARRAAATARLLNSLSPDQRNELADLMSTALADLGLAAEMDRLSQALRQRRPDLDWSSRERTNGRGGLSLGDAVGALEELADLDDLEATIAQDYPGASLEDIDADTLERALGTAAVDDLDTLRQIERELEQAGYLRRANGEWELTPKAVRRLGSTALRRVFAHMSAEGIGDHDNPGAGSAGELTGTSRPWRFGDEQPIDVVGTVRNAVLRGASASGRPGGRIRLAAEDFAVHETERRTSAAVALLVDLSYSMALRGTWGTAKSTALALHALVESTFPQDAIEVIGFSDYARRLRPEVLAGLSWDMVQGTNLQHGLMLARRHLARHRDAEPIVLVVTDGEPTAHLRPDGYAEFSWPPLAQTLSLTMAEVDALTRFGATINVFMLDDEPRLVDFVESMARRNGGRVFAPSADQLGEYVVSDYLRARRGRRRAG